MTHSVLVIFSHPAFESSRINRMLNAAGGAVEGVRYHDLYERYPEQIIDVDQEQQLLDEHDVVVFQHPLQWYSCPALMKNWIDSVLSYGWAYGAGGNAMRGKYWVHAISTGGAASMYQRLAYNQFSIAELLRPFEQTAALCGMNFLQPFLTQDVSNLNDARLQQTADGYAAWLANIVAGELPPVVHTVTERSAEFLTGYYSALNPEDEN